MKIRVPQMVAAELRRLTSTKMARLALVALMAVPVIYGGLYLWANQDPYAKLDQVPVALVVEDAGTTDDDGTVTNSGDDVADQLIEDGSFEWHRVTAATAEAGVDDGRYDFSVTLPADFSAALASSSTDAPYQAAVILTTNDANSYLATTIGEQAAKTIKASVVESVNEKAASQFLVGLSDIRGQLVTAVDGSGQLLTGSQDLITGAASARDGAAQLADGTTQLLAGANTAVDGSSSLSSGLTQLDAGAATLSSSLADGAAQTAGLPAQANQLDDGATKVADGATQLATGAHTLADGAATVADGSTKLAAGAHDLSDGAKQVADGSAQVAAGNAQLAQVGDALGGAAQSVVDQIPSIRADITSRLTALGLTDQQIADVLARLDPLGDAATEANAGAQEAVGQIDQLAAGAQKVADGAAALNTGADTLASSADALAAGAGRVSTGAGTLASSADTLAAGAAQVATGTGTLASKAPEIATGFADAAAGASQLSDGLETASAGAGTLSSGLVTLRDGIATADTGAASLRDGLGTLGSGLGTLQTGIRSLDDGLSSGVDQIPDNSASQQDAQSSNIANPVDVDSQSVTAAGTYGAGLAPFFVSLAAWIGIYALFLIVKPVSKRAITALHSPIKITLAGWLTPGLLGAIQMIALFFVVSVALGFSVSSPIGVYGVMALASLTFAAIILALNVWLGSVGQFLGLVLMVVQLVTAGGTFPWQTLPAPLAALHHVLPMGFAVDAIRQLMYGGDASAALGDAGTLLLWLVGGLLLAAVGVIRMTHTRTLRDLEPSLIG